TFKGISLNSRILSCLFSLSWVFLLSSAISLAEAGSLLRSFRRNICLVIGSGGAAAVPALTFAPTMMTSAAKTIAASSSLIELAETMMTSLGALGIGV